MFKNRLISCAPSPLENGEYICSCCKERLFSAQHKFDSKTGFPSFWAHLDSQVKLKHLSTYNRERIQLLCLGCGQHLGHLFPDPRTPSQVRYCINAEAIQYQVEAPHPR